MPYKDNTDGFFIARMYKKYKNLKLLFIFILEGNL